LKTCSRAAARVLQLSKSIPPEQQEKIAKAAIEAMQLEQRLQEAQHQIGDPRSAQDKQRLETQVRKLQKERDEREATLKSQSFRLVEVFEYPFYFDRALETAITRLMVILPGSNDQAMHHLRIQAIKKLLSSKVSVYIGFGIDQDNPTPKKRRNDPDVHDPLDKGLTNHSRQPVSLYCPRLLR